MTGLKDRLQADLTTAMKARDELRSATLRMVLTAVKTEEVAGKSARELDDAEVVTVLSREAKKRREAAEAFDEGGRPERAERERAEGEVIGELPAGPARRRRAARPGRGGDRRDRRRRTAGHGPGHEGRQPEDRRPAEGGRVAAEVRRQLAG